MTNSANNTRIAKNALFLYLRMFLVMGVSLYTSRAILQALGVEDFGIYNVVAGIVVLFSFINNAMAIASQRFLSFALGKNDNLEVQRVFSLSLTAHISIALIVFLLAESVGLLLLWKMNFPIDRIDAVAYTYHFAVLTCIVNILRVPYNASIVAYEKMSFYAWISIVEVVLKLLIVFLLLFYRGDKLIFYSFQLLVVTILINIIFWIYCRKNFNTIKYKFVWDSCLLKKYLNFSGWSLAGSLAIIGSQQGLNMIINIFCGVIVNAAFGISNQILGALYQFIGNFQTAFNPQLVKSYASGDSSYFFNLIFKTSKFSYYLMFIIGLPIILNCSFILNIWLGTVPCYAVEFSQLVIIFLLIDAICGPLWISVQATGDIKFYQIVMSILILLNLPLAYLVLYWGYSPVIVMLMRVIINFITLLVRLVFLKSLIHLSLRDFFVSVILPIIIVTILSIPVPLCLHGLVSNSWINFLLISVLCVLLSSFSIFVFGMTKSERKWIMQFFNSRIIKK